ncbi:MAG TPA: molybdopterin-guanine dinucleotide biosynthesis protein B [Thermoanaerobaculia bacterium]|nr:molybdopterin-guanine dinucleotide biosynthesis protein B [Thermoanaerobaculia bacterium]
MDILLPEAAAEPSRSSAASVRPGIDVLLDDPSPIAGRRIGLITNPSGVTSGGVPTWKALFESGAGKLFRLFGPEHGVDGGAIYMEAVGNAIHPPTGLPAVSLYGATCDTLRPRREDLAGLDAIVFDVADVGARYYTYNWTMMLAMEACAEAGLRLVVCDRPNPIGGAVEGAPQEEKFLSFVGMYPVPVRHGMTTGELAHFLAEEKRLDVDLVVSPISGWAREMEFSRTGLPWVSPSPNIPSPTTALVYPGMCLLEGTNLSEARGTTRPFEMFGAPWLSAGAFADALNTLELPGVSFVPVHFRPMFDKHAGETCGGALFHITDAKVFRAFETGMRIIETARRLDPNRFAWRTEPYEFDPRPAIDLLTGSTRFREAVDSGAGLDVEIARHAAGAAEFLPRRAAHLAYPDRKPAAVAFVGGHESGKTTVLVELVPRLKARGFTVGTIKHTSKDAEDDVPGKDSHLHSHSGADVSAFLTPERATSRRLGRETDLEELLAREFSDCDLVLIEGFKSLPVPKIEVTRERAPRPSIEGILARISDRPAEDGLPTHAFGDVEGIVATILRLAGLDRGRRA